MKNLRAVYANHVHPNPFKKNHGLIARTPPLISPATHSFRQPPLISPLFFKLLCRDGSAFTRMHYLSLQCFATFLVASLSTSPLLSVLIVILLLSFAFFHYFAHFVIHEICALQNLLSHSKNIPKPMQQSSSPKEKLIAS